MALYDNLLNMMPPGFNPGYQAPQQVQPQMHGYPGSQMYSGPVTQPQGFPMATQMAKSFDPMAIMSMGMLGRDQNNALGVGAGPLVNMGIPDVGPGEVHPGDGLSPAQRIQGVQPGTADAPPRTGCT
jgi:hypothetical protein